VGHNKQISGKLRISFRTKFQNLLNNFFLLCKGMHILCTRTVIISYKNQPYLLSLSGSLEEKNGKISGA